MTNYIIYDYLSFVSKIHSPYGLIEYLGLSDLKFENLKGFYGYRDRLYYDGISVHYNGREDMGVCCEMSGKGCRAWEKYGTSDYEGLFSEILSNYSDDSEKRQMNITRLDVAYDDFTGVIDLDFLVDETKYCHFVSRFRDYSYIGGNKGMSVIHGSNKSNVYIRCYDKRLEQNMEKQIEHWVRLELQIRKECALGFIQNKGDIREKYFAVLNNYLRYIVPTDNTTNSSMLDTAPYWLNFIESAERMTIFHKPADNYSFDKLYGYVNNQLSGAITTYMECVGTDQFLKDIQASRKGKKLNPKYQALIDKYNEHGDNILKFLDKKKGEDIV